MRWSNSSSFSAASARSRSSARAIRSCSSSAGWSRLSSAPAAGRAGTARPRAARSATASSAPRASHISSSWARTSTGTSSRACRLGDEDAVRVAAVDDDVAAELELIRHAAAVDDRHARRGRLMSATRKRRPFFAYPAPCTGPTTRPHERDEALCARQLARLRPAPYGRRRSRRTAGRPRAPPRPRARGRDGRNAGSGPRWNCTGGLLKARARARSCGVGIR